MKLGTVWRRTSAAAVATFSIAATVHADIPAKSEAVTAQSACRVSASNQRT